MFLAMGRHLSRQSTPMGLPGERTTHVVADRQRAKRALRSGLNAALDDRGVQVQQLFEVGVTVVVVVTVGVGR